ncbi:L,D-transpeptidase family protein [Rhodoferax fermentans]|uniref:L,D-transpeptidase family protein n=1 Tax=Rhodoferax fermentans TaxID=28066 RepID=UPI0014746FB1|nr:L,D-transpeptidase family protein [Rhodoferax fermentans]
MAKIGAQNLMNLRAESQLRLAAIKQIPPPDAIPSQFVSLSSRNKHAHRSGHRKARLYLFENTTTGTRLLANYYISVGKAGVGKTVEGDRRTPLGVYFITSNLDPKTLKDLYGSGALPVNYPNVLDQRRGKTGGAYGCTAHLRVNLPGPRRLQTVVWLLPILIWKESSGQ